MSQPIADWTGVQRLWIRVFMSILILVNITLSNLAIGEQFFSMFAMGLKPCGNILQD